MSSLRGSLIYYILLQVFSSSWSGPVLFVSGSTFTTSNRLSNEASDTDIEAIEDEDSESGEEDNKEEEGESSDTPESDADVGLSGDDSDDNDTTDNSLDTDADDTNTGDEEGNEDGGDSDADDDVSLAEVFRNSADDSNDDEENPDGEGDTGKGKKGKGKKGKNNKKSKKGKGKKGKNRNFDDNQHISSTGKHASLKQLKQRAKDHSGKLVGYVDTLKDLGIEMATNMHKLKGMSDQLQHYKCPGHHLLLAQLGMKMNAEEKSQSELSAATAISSSTTGTTGTTTLSSQHLFRNRFTKNSRHLEKCQKLTHQLHQAIKHLDKARHGQTSVGGALEKAIQLTSR